MKKYLLSSFVLLSAFLCFGGAKDNSICSDSSFVMCQFNMRYKLENDGKFIQRKDLKRGIKKTVLDGSQTWEKRAPLIQAFLEFNDVDICGTQELKKTQVEYFNKMSDEFSYFGIPTEPEKYDTLHSSANNIIIYRKARLELLKSGAFWLSETPEKAMKGFGAAYPRNCNWGLFKDKKSGKEFYFFSTHIHHIGDETKAKSAELIIKKIREIAGDKPFFLVGDFNMAEEHYGMKPIWDCDFMVDARKVCKTKLYGPNFTNNYGYTGLSTVSYPTSIRDNVPMQWIDWVFVSKSVDVFKCGVMSECINGIWLSDHFPVLLKVSIK
ncbi:MAG: endonuclease/exonuclease/phosphatase family protein [Verrucomicrobiaceae bacterium]|nr:endonuclease/exonuclease/phosphatase family protein [Verrucomicrobiaceae bacterium]